MFSSHVERPDFKSRSAKPSIISFSKVMCGIGLSSTVAWYYQCIEARIKATWSSDVRHADLANERRANLIRLDQQRPRTAETKP